MSTTNAKLIDAWDSIFASEESYFVTLTFNFRATISSNLARQMLSKFSRRLDEPRLGGRFYRETAPHRTVFLFAQEKWDSYPHFHGVVLRPDEGRSLRPASDFATLMTAAWAEVAPAGIAHIQRYRDEGALFYASKESRLHGEGVITSFELWSPALPS